jgi:hypothetical protein
MAATPIYGQSFLDANTAIGKKTDAPIVDPAVEATMINLLKGVLTKLISTLPVSISGSFNTAKTIKTGAKTVSTTAAEVFSGASRLANRYLLGISNEGTVPIEIGDSSLAIGSGWKLQPGDSLTLQMSPTSPLAIYAIAQSSCPVKVVELS